jgi:hypothetical protein
MAKREIGMRPLEPITSDVAVQKIVQTLERLGSQSDRIRAIKDAGNKALPGLEVRVVSVAFKGLDKGSQGVRK